MRRRFSLSFAVATLLASRSAWAEDHAFDKVRFGAWGVVWAGTRLEGAGSVAHIQKAAPDLEISAVRYFSDSIGVDVLVLGLPLRGESAGYARFDVGLDGVLWRWHGSAPGGITMGLGIGGDFGERYTYAGRFYPRGTLRARVAASRENTLELSFELLPAAAGPKGNVIQHRSELSFARGLFQAGFRVSHAFHTVGEPRRTFMTQELGLFVGVGIMP